MVEIILLAAVSFAATNIDDILLNMNILLRDNPVALDTISSRFRYIMVDEYQDTNHAQYLLTALLAEGSGNICVVGDDDQSIYRFRGASPQIMLGFPKDFRFPKIPLESAYKQCGNSVVVPVIRRIAEQIKKVLEL